MSYSLIEPLESRIAPASLISASAVSYKDAAGDIVTVSFSKAIFAGKNGLVLANKVFDFDSGTVLAKGSGLTTGQELTEIDLTQAPQAAGTSITVAVKKVSGTGEANIGEINATGMSLGNIKIKGNLGSINAGLHGYSFYTLTADSLGSATGSTLLTSTIAGPVVGIHVNGDVENAHVIIGSVSRGNIGTLTVTGDLIGGSEDHSGEVEFTGSIGVAKIGALDGGAGVASGTLLGHQETNSYITSLTVNGAVTGSSGAGSGQISAGSMRTVFIDGALVGGDGLNSGLITAKASIATLTINGDITGGTAGDDMIPAVAMTPAVAAVAGHSGAVMAGGIGTLTIDGSLRGGTDLNSTQNAQESGEIAVVGSISRLVITGDITADNAFDSGWVSAGTVGSVSIGGAISGGTADDSGQIVSSGAITSIKIGGSVTGSSGDGTGQISGAAIGSLTIGGTLTGGSGDDSGEIHFSSSLGTTVIGPAGAASNVNSILGGSGNYAGSIRGDAGSILTKLTVNGSVAGADGLNSGQITGGTLSVISISGNVTGGTGGVSGTNGNSGSIVAASIGTVAIGGSLSGVDSVLSHTATAGGTIQSVGAITSVTIGGDVKGSNADGTGQITGTAIGTLSIGGNLLGGAGDDSGEVHFSTSLGTVTIGKAATANTGDVTGSSGSYSGSIKGDTGTTLTSLTINGDLTGGDGLNSGQISGGTLTTVAITGNVQGGDAGQDLIPAQAGPPAVDAVPAVAGHSGAIISSGGMGTVTVGGSLIGGTYASAVLNAQESGEIVAAGTITNLTIKGNITGANAGLTGEVQGGWVSAATITGLTVNGALIGGSGSDSGEVHFTTALGTAVIGTSGAASTVNSVMGGAGSYSGSVKGDVGSTLTSLTVNGSVTGANGLNSGQISGGTLTTIGITGNLAGGTAGISGTAGNAGSILGASIGSLTIGGSVTGGNSIDATHTAMGSGSVVATGGIASLIITGSLEGGTGDQSGMITLGGKLTTGNIGGNVVSGTGIGISDSGSIRAGADIGSLTIGGSVQGNATNKVYISAVGPAGVAATATADVAIGTLTIKGSVDHAEILAGYGTDATTSNPRGSADNGNAQIGTVTIGTVANPGNLSATSIVAGVIAGADGQFGTADDAAISTMTNQAISSIASIVVTGTAVGAVTGSGDTNSYGFVAKNVISASVGGTAITLQTGPDNDTFANTATVPLGTTLSIVEV